MEIKNKVQYIDINELIELENNPRQILDKDFEILKKSIEEDKDFFEARPIICNEVNGKKIVIAGNQRLKVSKELGLKEVPCVVFHNLSKEKQDKIMFRDNINNGTWDIKILEKDYKDFDFEDVGMINISLKEMDIKINPEYYQDKQNTARIEKSNATDNTIKQEQKDYPIYTQEDKEEENNINEEEQEKYIYCPNCNEKIKI